MYTTLELKSEKAKTRNQLVDIAKMLRNVRNFILNLTSSYEVIEEKKFSTNTLVLLKKKLQEFQEKEAQLHHSVERFFEKSHLDEKYSLYFLSYHLLLKKVAEISYHSENIQNHSEFLEYLKEQQRHIQSYFQHTKEDVKKLSFWGKDFLHDIIHLIQDQSEFNKK